MPNYLSPPLYVDEWSGGQLREGIKLGPVHIRPLKSEENQSRFPERVSNSLLLYHVNQFIFPQPLGLIYAGRSEEILMGNARGYFLTNFVEGENLFSRFEHLNNEERSGLFGAIGIWLGYLRKEGRYLLDFAPRDIRLRDGDFNSPVFVDTEHAKYVMDSKGSTEELLQEQINQFNEDYGYFLNPKELSDAVKLVFDPKWSV